MEWGDLIDVIKAILSRRSIRKYTCQEITPEQVEMLLRAAMAAPNTVNNRDWAFIVVRSRQIMAKIVENQRGHGNMLADAQVAIIVCGDLQLAYQKCPDFWVQDCAAATENILLAAVGMGLGGVWVGVYPLVDRVKGLQEICGLPEHIVPFAVVSLGIPDENPPLRHKFESEKIHYERW